MASPLYKLVLTDRSFVPQGEIRNFGRFTFNRALSKLATCSFAVRLDNMHADRLAAADGLVKVYRAGVLLFVGPIITAEETADRNTQTIAVTCADIGWILGKRVTKDIGGSGVSYTSLADRAQIAKSLIDAANNEATTGITTATYTLSAGSSITYKAGPYAPVLNCVQELGGALDGFDWLIRPVENWANGALASSNVGAFQAQPVIGTTQSNAVFEYGVSTRSNVLSYTRVRTRDTQANRVHHVAANGSVVTHSNTTAITVWGLLEDALSVDLTSEDLRAKLVQEHGNVRGYPRDLIRMTPHIDPGVTGRLPKPFVDYDVGDTISFNAVANKSVRFSGQVRVYGITINVEQETGFERVTLALEDEN